MNAQDFLYAQSMMKQEKPKGPKFKFWEWVIQQIEWIGPTARTKATNRVAKSLEDLLWPIQTLIRDKDYIIQSIRGISYEVRELNCMV